MKSRKKHIPTTQIGVGSGGNQLGPNNPCWKGGYSIYKKTYNSNPQSRVCELCKSTKFLVIHHKDGNRENGRRKNLMRVCRKCHAKLHNLVFNLR